MLNILSYMIDLYFIQQTLKGVYNLRTINGEPKGNKRLYIISDLFQFIWGNHISFS